MTIGVPTSAYERAQTGRATKQIEVSRADYENRMGIAGLRKIWACSPEKLQSMAENARMRLDMVDSSARWPMTSTPIEMTEETAEKISQHAKGFFDSKDLADDNRNRVVLFVGINSDSNSLIDVLNPEIWQVAHDRLIELGAIKSTAEYQTPTPAKNLDVLSADELAVEANQNYQDTALPLLANWRISLRNSWGIELTDRLRDIAVDILERHNLNPLLAASYDFIRVQMANRKLITTTKTADGRPLTRAEYVADEIDRKNLDLSRPENKRWFMEQQDLILNGGE
jgi:hypothetical protein